MRNTKTTNQPLVDAELGSNPTVIHNKSTGNTWKEIEILSHIVVV